MDLPRGARFDRYVIEALIGQGGMGRVYRAYDERLERSVALKILDAASSAELDARFVREARAAAALNHPNVVSVFDVGESGGEAPTRFIAMELVEGYDLRALAVDPAVDRPARIRWLADVARALAVAHRAGIVHRDVKPENVMVRADGVVKVLDFGLARRATQPAPTGDISARTLTERGVVVGTPMYMSPEQLRGDAVDGRADQFAWGVMAYELLARASPWKRNTEAVTLIAEILTTEPPPLATCVPDLDPRVANTVTRALSKSAADRFPTMDAVLEILEGLAPKGTIPPLAPPPKGSVALAYAPTVQSTRTSLAAAEAMAQVTQRLRGRWRARLAGGVLAIASAGVAIGALWRHRAPVVAGATRDAAPAPTTVADLPLPPDTRPDVAAEYKQAMERVRFADLHGAGVHATKATELDPSFAPALLFMAINLLPVSGSEARDLFRRAQEHQNRLTERDRLLLNAYEPLVQGSPPDAKEARVRLERAVARFPLDAGLHSELAAVDGMVGDLPAKKAELDRALALDPAFGEVLCDKSFYDAYMGDFDAALADSDRCAQVAPSVPNCLEVRDEIDRQAGRCEDLEKRMRRAIGVEPSMPDWYAPLAEALYAAGRPLASVREAAVQGDAHATPSARSGLTYTYYPVVVDILGGDFAHADEELRAAEASPDVAKSLDASVHALPLGLRVDLALEMGHVAEAGALAEEYLSRREAWLSDPANDPYTLLKDIEPKLLRALRKAKRIDAHEEEQRRAAWIERRTKEAPDLRGNVWLLAYADDLEGADEAKRAMAALPEFEPLPKLAADWAVDARLGRAQFLAGDVAEALPTLRRAAAACSALAQPMATIRAVESLGEALEPTDRAGACGAYARVLSAWGHAKPSSITADRARARARAAGCAPQGGG